MLLQQIVKAYKTYLSTHLSAAPSFLSAFYWKCIQLYALWVFLWEIQTLDLDQKMFVPNYPITNYSSVKLNKYNIHALSPKESIWLSLLQLLSTWDKNELY